jgi:membrane protease subunit HflK
MFERLIDLLLSLGDKLLPCFIIEAYEAGAVLRFGKYHRGVDPGIHWKIPFVERVIEIVACTTTMRLPPQTLTTADGKSVVVTAIVRYNVRDVKPYVTDIYDQHDALGDVTMGAIREAVRSATLEQLASAPPEKEIATSVRRKVGRYGIEVEAVTFSDLAAVRSFRLIQASPKDIDN